MSNLNGKRVAFLVTNGYEPSELSSPWETVVQQGGEAILVSPQSEEVSSGEHRQAVDLNVADANAADFDALVLPGGTKNSDQIRMNADAVKFTRAFFDANKTVASICHAAWILTEADVLEGRKLTSYPSLQTDLRNAGAQWSDEEVVIDDNLITSRTPADLPAFNQAITDKLTT